MDLRRCSSVCYARAEPQSFDQVFALVRKRNIVDTCSIDVDCIVGSTFFLFFFSYIYIYLFFFCSHAHYSVASFPPHCFIARMIQKRRCIAARFRSSRNQSGNKSKCWLNVSARAPARENGSCKIVRAEQQNPSWPNMMSSLVCSAHEWEEEEADACFAAQLCHFEAFDHNAGTPSGAVLRQWIGLDVTECPSHLCMSCKLYRPAHFWKNILSCCSKDVKLVTYDVRWLFLWEFLTRMLDSEMSFLLQLRWGFIAGVVLFEGHRMLCKSSQPGSYHLCPLSATWWLWSKPREQRVTHFLVTDGSGPA